MTHCATWYFDLVFKVITTFLHFNSDPLPWQKCDSLLTEIISLHKYINDAEVHHPINEKHKYLALKNPCFHRNNKYVFVCSLNDFSQNTVIISRWSAPKPH